ncbi:MAG TPA: PAS domain S-box protein, partial [Negativicutes bacterium]|nr:PAS domain S-box protein [Negativicutes bacterium]
MESRPMKILMIDDNQDNLTILKTLILEAFPNASVLSALNGQKGLELAASEEPDIILLDIIMPGLDGYEVCRRLKADENLCDIPIVFITAIRSNKESRIKALECGAEAFLAKPIDDIELTAQIRAMLKIRDANIQKRDDRRFLAALVEGKTKELVTANTELQKTVEALKSEQALIEAIFDSIPGYLYVYDESGQLIKWNQKHETMTGYSTEELAHMSLDKWFDQKDIMKVKTAVRDVFEKGYGEVEAWLTLKNGGKMLTRSSGVPLILNGKKYFTGIGVDITEQNRLEKTLLESQRIAHLGTWSLDLRTNQVIWSEELYKMYGFDPRYPPPPYTEHMKLFTSDSWERLSKALEYTRTFGIPYELELQTVMIDGTNGWMWVRGEAKTDVEGNIVSLWGAAQDITERKRVEIELEQSEERFKLLFEKAPLGYQSLDSDGYFIEVNQQWLDTFEYSREEVIGKWFGNFLCTEYIAAFQDRFPVFKSQGHIHSEFEMLSKSGKRLFISFEGKIAYDANGGFIQTHCILQNITDQKIAEANLRESERTNRLLLDHLHVGIVLHNADSSISFSNPLACELLGLTANQMLNKFVSDKAWRFYDTHGELLSEESYPFSRVYRDKNLVNYEMGISKEGAKDIKWILVNGFVIQGKTGDTEKILISFIDITEKKQTEKEVEYLAYHDYLTDTYNRRYFESEYSAKNTAAFFPLVILTGDLNGLKLINDSFGHRSGDLAIQQFAIEIRKQIPNDAILARIGGDEFAVILFHSTEADAKQYARDLQSTIRLTVRDQSGDDADAELTATFGYSIQSYPGQGLDELLKEAETFMYRRKSLENTSKRSHVIDAIMGTLFEKSEREQKHSLRVSAIASAIATAMGLDDAVIAKVRV